MRQKFKSIKKFLPIIGLILFIYTIYTLEVNKIIDAFLSINPFYLLIALPLTLPRILIRNYAWHLIQKEQHIHVSFWQSLNIFLIGYFYGSITPGYIGQLMRIPYLKERTKQPYGKLFVNSTIETMVHTSSLYVMIFIGALLVLGSFPDIFYIIVIWLLIFIGVILFFVKRERGEKVFYKLIYYFIPKNIKTHFYQFVDSFYHDFPRIRNLLFPLFLGVFTWVIIFSQEYLIVIALDLPIPYLLFLLLFPVANAAGFIPITFAGLGTREVTAIVIFTTLFEVPAEKIFVVSLLGFIITDIATGFIGFLCSVWETKTNKKNKSTLFDV
mgnify:CR=1 FL=1